MTMLCKDFVIISLMVARVAFSLANELQMVTPEAIEFRPVDDLDRKIVSKSIFVAPLFRKCPEGYILDTQGGCFRYFRVDEEAHWNNLVAQLNKFYETYRRQASSIPVAVTPVTLPQPFEYKEVNSIDGPDIILNNNLSKAPRGQNDKPLHFQLPLPMARRQQSNSTGKE